MKNVLHVRREGSRFLLGGLRFSIVTMSLLWCLAASAGHRWGTYHWANEDRLPIPLKVIDSVTDVWQEELENSLAEWSDPNDPWGDLNGRDSLPSPLFEFYRNNLLSNDARRYRRRCKAETGQMRVCNGKYGSNGWLGIASIGVDSNAHIVAGTVKINDTYASYWEIPGEKNHVMCQEIGHILGLGHTSENGSSQRTCMDYSLSSDSQWPNLHDYQELEAIYDHRDTYNSYDEGLVGVFSENSRACSGLKRSGCEANEEQASDEEHFLGVLMHRHRNHEIWVAPRGERGLWVHHVRRVPEVYR